MPSSTTWPPVSSAVSASKPSNRRRDRPRTGQIPVRARPAKPAVAATWHHRGMSDALPAGSTLADAVAMPRVDRSEEHTSELQSLMRISYAVFCLKKKKTKTTQKVIHESRVQKAEAELS